MSGSGRHSKLKPISLPQGILWHPTLQGSLTKASRGSGTWGHPGAHWPAPVEERGAQEADYCCWLTRYFFCRIEAGLQSGADAWLKTVYKLSPMHLRSNPGFRSFRSFLLTSNNAYIKHFALVTRRNCLELLQREGKCKDKGREKNDFWLNDRNIGITMPIFKATKLRLRGLSLLALVNTAIEHSHHH